MTGWLPSWKAVLTVTAVWWRTVTPLDDGRRPLLPFSAGGSGDVGELGGLPDPSSACKRDGTLAGTNDVSDVSNLSFYANDDASSSYELTPEEGSLYHVSERGSL